MRSGPSRPRPGARRSLKRRGNYSGLFSPMTVTTTVQRRGRTSHSMWNISQRLWPEVENLWGTIILIVEVQPMPRGLIGLLPVSEVQILDVLSNAWIACNAPTGKQVPGPSDDPWINDPHLRGEQSQEFDAGLIQIKALWLLVT